MMGIEDILETIQSALFLKISLSVSEHLVPGELNIIIDEFSNPDTLIAIRDIRSQFPTTRIALIATEFLTRDFLGGYTFNRFSRDFRSNTKSFYARCLKTNFSVLRSLKKQFFSEPQNYVVFDYMHQRCQGFIKALSLIDLIVTVHEGIACSLRNFSAKTHQTLPALYSIFPVIDFRVFDDYFQKSRLAFAFEVTGSVTRYRKRIVEDINAVLSHTLTNFEPVRTRSFAEQTKYDGMPSAAFSIHAPQTADWQFSSPMRIYRSLRQGQAPLLTKKFGDHPIEGVGLYFDGDPEFFIRLHQSWRTNFSGLVSSFRDSIRAYNELARRENRHVLEAMTSSTLIE
jgi:hypothetical protein